MRTDLTGLTFIVVAGDKLASGDLAESLRIRGAKAVIASTCAAAFEALEQQPPDFAVLDWSMADCDAVAAELNALDIPHIYIGSPNKRDRESVRNHFSGAFADAMLMLINDDEMDAVPFLEAHQLGLR